MNGDKPSYITSTTSQVLIITVIGYVLGAVALAVVGALKSDIGLVATAQQSLESLLTIMLPLYAVRKGLEEGKKNGSHPAPAEASAAAAGATVSGGGS